jgi:GNAT superfamily N-acetyltransferase
MSLEESLFRNEIVREALGAGEIDRLLATVDRRLEDASFALLHPETRLEQAYHAILGCAVIGLRAHGLRAVDRPGHHVVALESLADTIGTPLERIDYFQTLRDLRNKGIYTGSSHVSDTQALEAVEEARRLVAETKDWLRKRRQRT